MSAHEQLRMTLGRILRSEGLHDTAQRVDEGRPAERKPRPARLTSYVGCPSCGSLNLELVELTTNGPPFYLCTDCGWSADKRRAAA